MCWDIFERLFLEEELDKVESERFDEDINQDTLF